MIVHSAAALEQGIRQLFRACGVAAAQAAVVAEHLVDAESRGVSSHGMIRVPQYVDAIQENKIRLDAQLQVVRESQAAAVFDGQGGFGQVMAQSAMQAAAQMALRTGVAAATLTNCYHTGRLGSFTEQAARAGRIGLMMVNSGGHGQWVAPYGGTQGRLATNPLSIAVPRGDESPLVVDFATSIAPEGRLRALLTAGKSMPEGWAIDHLGRPTTNPAEVYGPPRGAILPFGGHKGFGLSLMVDILAGVLSGAGGCVDALAPLAGKTDGVFMLAIEIESFCPRDTFFQSVSQIVRHVKTSPPMAGVAEVLVPGEIEARTRAQRLQQGIPIEAGTWRLIEETARRLHLASEEIFGQTNRLR